MLIGISLRMFVGFKDKRVVCQVLVNFVLEFSQRRQRTEARVGVRKWIRANNNFFSL